MPDPTEILAKIRHKIGHSPITAWRQAEALLAAVESVLGLHKPVTRFRRRGYENESVSADDVIEISNCQDCAESWPCPTVRAITDALGGGDDAE